MSLFERSLEVCVMIDRRLVKDGQGGYTSIWQDGVDFDAAVVKDQSDEVKVAEAQGVKAIYTVCTKKNINLQYHDVFRRVSDGKIFRVTSDGDDSATPRSAVLNMRTVTAEEWVLPNPNAEGSNNNG